jgi:class 3 adenylate cyclase/DNA-binding CsgD family transcriptional regulator
VEVIAMPRQVQTLLFTDIVGSTDRLRNLGDAAWAALLVRHHSVIRAVLAAHGGREVNTAGDGFLARFDAPARAVRAAAVAVAAVAPLGIEIRAGLHTGEVELAGDQISGVGVHLAARVMAQADAGQVLVTSTVRELMAGSELGFVEFGMRELKGFTESWRLFALDPATVQGDGEVVSEPVAGVAGRGGTGVPFAGLRPVKHDSPGEMGGRVASPTFVGRIEELQTLEAARRRAADGEPAAVVLVGGEAGVGKTRLVAELTAHCATDGTQVLVGGCVPVGDGALPYAPIVEALRALLTDLGAGAVRELVGPSWPELARLLPALGEPDRTVLPDQAAQARLFELLLGLLGRLSEQTPLVVVVEDLHWADRSTRDLLAFLTRNLRRERVLLVVTYRNDEPGQQRLGPYLAELDRAGRVERIELSRLDQVQTGAQLVGILRAAPAAELVDAVFARSEGNPFFTEELLAVVRAGAGELPATLRDLLRGRVQALPEPAQHMLEVVAVASRRVPHRLLASVAGLDDRQLDGALRAAVASQLLVTTPGEDGYDVRHALLREVIDADLLPGERARLHIALAHALADLLRSDELDWPASAAEVAVHWDRAHNRANALEWSVRAGVEADKMHAYAEAFHHYGRALKLWGQVSDAEVRAGRDHVEVLQRAAEAVSISGDNEQALDLIDRALHEVDPRVEPARAGLLHERRGTYLMITRDIAFKFEALREALRLVPADPPSTERARLLISFAETLVVAARNEEARATSEEAVAIARQLNAEPELGYALCVVGWSQAAFGAFEDGIASLREACRLAEKYPDPNRVARAYGWLGEVLMQAGRLEDAVEASLSGRALMKRLGLAGYWHDNYLLMNAAEALFKLGRWDEADRLATQALAEARPDYSSGPLLIVTMLEIGRGDFQAAEAHLERIEVSLHGEADKVRCYAELVAELWVWQGRLEEARAAVQDGLDRVASTDERVRSGKLLCLGMRVEADQAERGRAHHDQGGVEAAIRAADALASQAAAMVPSPLVTGASPVLTTSAVVALFDGERSRLEGHADPAQWQTAATAWLALGRPHPAAYAHWRQAEALLASRAPRAQAEEPLRAGHAVAVRLGAAPLRHELELLAQRGRLRLQEQVDTVAEPEAPSSPAASLGLTRREAEVLALVAAGRTNRQIGETLFITPKTASVHVSRILAKLRVADRGEAAAVAHRLGLDKQ